MTKKKKNMNFFVLDEFNSLCDSEDFTFERLNQ